MGLSSCDLLTHSSDRAEPFTIRLTPAQNEAAQELCQSIATANVCLLNGEAGMGKTSILHDIGRDMSATYVAAGDFLSLLRLRSPWAIEESLMETLEGALCEKAIVLVDDLHLLTAVLRRYEYPRAYLVDIVLRTLIHRATQCEAKLIFADENDEAPPCIQALAVTTELDSFTEQDFAAICSHYLGESASLLDFDKIFRFAPGLNAHQLRNACTWLTRRQRAISTDDFVDYLRTRNLMSNVDLEEVEPVTWSDLQGMDDVIDELEAKVALPFQTEARILELDLKPKRGVLLAGPPGTGKTTIGRALAHRLQGKFFLIDGTVNAANHDFYNQVEKIFEAAKRNAPSVIFIDDADVLFEAANQGLFRYLLTMMDGLESVSSGQVCVMITAMDTTVLPPALLRSGRVELWLYTRLPDEQARAAIFRDRLNALPPPICDVDDKLLARKSRGLSGADLKTVVEEGKLLYAHAMVNRKNTQPEERFFLSAISNALANRRQYGKRISSSSVSSRFGFQNE